MSDNVHVIHETEVIYLMFNISSKTYSFFTVILIMKIKFVYVKSAFTFVSVSSSELPGFQLVSTQFTL